MHDKALEDFGGLPGRDKNKLEGILAMPMAGFGDHEEYPTIEQKAAIYLYYLASAHGFKDGNKRTSYLAVFTFLDLNGYDLIIPDDEVYRFVLLLANDKTMPPFEEAVNWIEGHMRKQEE